MNEVKYFSFKTQRKFGCELEVTAHLDKHKLRDLIANIDQNHHIKISEYNEKDYGNSHWTVKRDGSCKDADFKYGFEIASFVGATVDDITLINNVVTKLQQSNVKVNDNCSVHVHVEVTDFSKLQIAKMVAIWMKIEKIMLQTVPERRRKSIYCVPLRKHHKAIAPDKISFTCKEDRIKLFSKIRPNKYDDIDRRVNFNICNVCSGLDAENKNYNVYGLFEKAKQKKRMTVELRMPEGSVDPQNVTNWIKLFVRFVNLSKKRNFPSDLSCLGLEDTLRFLGLHESKGTPFILSRGLWNLKVWFLQRILTFTDDNKLREEALMMLDYISNPNKKEIDKNKHLPNILVKAENHEPWMDLIPINAE